MPDSETTGLISGEPKPSYVFESIISRQRKRSVKQFQCCLCAVFLCALIAALVATVSFTLNGLNPTPNPNSTSDNDSSINFFLLTMTSPIEDLRRTVHLDNSSSCDEAVKAGLEALERRDAMEQESPTLPKDTPSYRHQKVVATTNKSRNLARSGYAEVHATKHYFERNSKNTTNLVICPGFKSGEKASFLFTSACKTNQTKCNPYHMYRSFNGSCNNLKNPDTFGAAYTAFKRIISPQYADGVSEPRKSKTGDNLPSARTVSIVVHRPYYRDDPKFTVMLAVWGQFIDHDVTATALSQGASGSPISCCNEQGSRREDAHSECFPVHLDSADPYYKDYNISCMEFVRSAPAPTCRLGPREQMNQVSSYLDGSVIYGTDDEVVNSLRSFVNGTLKMYITEDNRELLPVSQNPDDGCNREEESKMGRYCFATGDGRANENLHLTSMHLLWARHHNNLVATLKELNPHWNDEKLFQEARRILVAQMQHITFNEFLPILIGPELMEKHELHPKKKGHFNGYNESLDASMANSFAASAFRFAHTLIPTLMKLLANDSSSPEFIQLHKMLFDPFQLYKKGELDRALRGAMSTAIQASDPYFSPELKEHLFERTSEVDAEADRLGRSSSLIGSERGGRKLCGLDLVSLNIQRGRDHGLPGYTSWRERCGLQRPRSFGDLAGDIDDDSLHYIESIYSHVDDIDLYTGALSEIPRKNGILGTTVTCLILDQFIRLKKGDRFWYENHQEPHAFTENQLDEMRKTKLSNIICDNSDDVDVVQPYVMMQNTNGNERIACKDLQTPNWKSWKESYERVHVPSHNVAVKVVKKEN